MAAADRLTPTRTSSDAIGVTMYLVAAFLFALNGVIAKNAMNAGLDPLHLTQLRNAGSMILLALFVAAVAPQHLRVRRSELPFLIAYGVIAFTLVQFLYFVTISRLNVGIGTLLAFLAPVIVALWLRFGRKREVRNSIWLAIALTLIGLALVAQVWQGMTLDVIGVLAGLACAVALALYWLLGEAGQSHRDAVSLTMWGFVFASIAWAIVSPWWTFPWTTMALPTEPLWDAGPGLPVWSLMVWGVVMGTIAPFLLVLGSLRRLGAQRAGIVATTEPLWAFIIGFALLGEVITGMQMAGGLIVLAGVIVAETSRRSATLVTAAEFPPILEE